MSGSRGGSHLYASDRVVGEQDPPNGVIAGVSNVQGFEDIARLGRAGGGVVILDKGEA